MLGDWLTQARSALRRAGRSALLADTATTTVWGLIGHAVGFLIPFFIAAWYGVTAGTDAFFFSFGIVTFLGTVFMPVARGVLVPFVAELRAREEGDVAPFVGQVLGAATLVVALAGVVVAALLGPALPLLTDFAPDVLDLAYALLLETLPLVLLMTWSAVLMGVLDAHKRFAVPAVSPAFRSAVALVAIFALKGRLGLHAVPAGYVLGEAFRVLVLGALLGRLTGVRLGARHLRPSLGPRLRSFLGVALFQNLAMVASGLNPVVDRTMASWLPAGSVSVLYYAHRLYLIPMSLAFAGVVAVVRSHWSADLHAEGVERLRANVRSAFRLGGMASVAACVPLIALAGLAARLVLGRGEFPPEALPQVAAAWRLYLAGLAPHVLRVLYAQAFLALKQTRTLLKTALLINVLNVAFNYALMQRWGAPGIALSTTLTQLAALGYLRWKFAQATVGPTLSPQQPPRL
jgi:putative peptidoglycan lipid II flippase